MVVTYNGPVTYKVSNLIVAAKLIGKLTENAAIYNLY